MFNSWRTSLIAAVAMLAGLTAGIGNAQRNTPPTVSLSASATAIPVGGSSVMTAMAFGPGGSVVRVVFYSGGVQLAQDTAAPYTYTFSPATAGTYTLTAVATDNQLGQTTSAPVIFTVASAGNQAPTAR